MEVANEAKGAQRKGLSIASILLRNLTLGESHGAHGALFGDTTPEASTSDVKGKRRASDPPIHVNTIRPILHRSKSRTSVQSNGSNSSIILSPNISGIRSRPSRSCSLTSNVSKGSVKSSPSTERLLPRDSLPSTSTHVSFASAPSQTARQRSSSLHTSHDIYGESQNEITNFGQRAPARLRRESSASRIHRYTHAANEAQYNQERRLLYERVQMSRAVCICVLSIPDFGKGGWIIRHVSESQGPSSEFEWDIALDDACATFPTFNIDIYAKCSGADRTSASFTERWHQAVSWQFDSTHMVSLGRMRDSFPSFAPNTIIIQTQNGEYLTGSLQKRATFQEPLDVEADESLKDITTASTGRARQSSRAATLEAIARSRTETRMLISEDEQHLKHRFALSCEKAEAQAQLQKSHASLENIFATNEGWHLRREKDSHQYRLQTQQNRLLLSKKAQQRTRTSLDEQRDLLNKRKKRLTKARLELRKGILGSEELAAAVTDRDAQVQDLAEELALERGNLITVLDSFFSIAPHVSDLQREPNTLSFAINGLYLPNTEFPVNLGLLDDLYSSALGMAAQLTNLLAAYLGVALFYPMTCAGSRSLISDQISPMKGPRAFPLYATGVERYRFEYAVLLLNKNVEFILQSQGVIVMDLRHTLPNLKNLMLTLPSRADAQKPRRSAAVNVGDSAGSTPPTASPRMAAHDPGANLAMPLFSPSSPSETIRQRPPKSQVRARSPTPSEKVLLISDERVLPPYSLANGHSVG